MALSSNGFRPTTYGPWTNQAQFDAWHQGLKAGDPRRNYVWDGTEDIDQDGTYEGLVRNSQGGPVVGVNGFKLNRSNWKRRTNWKNPTPAT
jgi:hypothetical protein